MRGHNLKTTDGARWKIITGAHLLNSPVYILLVFSASQQMYMRKKAAAGDIMRRGEKEREDYGKAQ